VFTYDNQCTMTSNKS